MRERKSNNRAPLLSPMHIALLLLCAVLITSYATGGLYARYVSESSDDAGARVIFFGDISVSPEKNTIFIVPGTQIVLDTAVTFAGSESATYVFLKIEASAHWSYHEQAKQFQMQSGMISVPIHSDWTYFGQRGTGYIFYRELDPNTRLDASPVFANGGSVSEDLTGSTLGGLTNVYLHVQALAVQSIGFSSVDEAWTSVSTKFQN